MTRFLLHVGLPKCGSTSLQKAFGQCQDITYLGKLNGLFVDPEIGEFTRQVAPYADLRTTGAEPYKTAFNQAILNTGNDIVLLSDEVLSSVGFAPAGQSNSLPQIMQNVHRVVDAKIEVILVIREQISFLKSYYKQWIIGGGDLTFDEFIALLKLTKNRWLFPALHYVRLARAIRPWCDKVHILCFERLFGDPAYREQRLGALGLATAAQNLPGIHERPGASDQQIAIQLQVNRRIPTRQTTIRGHGLTDAELTGLRKKDRPEIRLFRRILKPLLMDIGQKNKAWKTAYETALKDEPAVQIAGDLYEIDPVLMGNLQRNIKRFNQRLGELDPETDWAGLGYLM